MAKCKTPKILSNPSDLFADFKGLNPEFDKEFLPKSSQEQLQNITHKPRGKERTENQQSIEIEKLRVSINSRIEQMDGNDTFFQIKKDRINQDFESSPRTIFKTIQEVLSAETDRIPIFYKDIDTEEKHQAVLSSLIIDPSRITNTLLENLGLESLKPKPRRRQHNQIKDRAEAIPEIIKMFQSLEPIIESSPNSLRLMRISKGKNKGYILGTQHINDEKKIFKTDLYLEERRLLRIEQSYKEEIKKLVWIKDQMQFVLDNLEKWNNIKGTSVIDELKKALAFIVNSLTTVQDSEKIKLKNQLIECLELKDSKGRDNPLIMRTRIRTAIDNLNSRTKKIYRISSYLAQDKVKINQIIEEENIAFRTLLQDFERKWKRFDIFKDGGHLEARSKSKIIGSLNKLKKDLEKARFQPNLAFSEEMILQIDKVLSLLSEDKNKDAQKEFLKIYLIAKLKRAQKHINDIHRNISFSPELVNPQDLKKDLEIRYSYLRNHIVSKSMLIDDYKKEYIEVYQLFDELIAKLDSLLDPETEKRFRKRTSRTILFEELMEKFSSDHPILWNLISKAKEKVKNKLENKFDIHFYSSKSINYTASEKNETYEEISKMIKELDFVELMKGIKD